MERVWTVRGDPPVVPTARRKRGNAVRGEVSDMLQLVVEIGNSQAMILPVTSQIESSPW